MADLETERPQQPVATDGESPSVDSVSAPRERRFGLHKIFQGVRRILPRLRSWVPVQGRLRLVEWAAVIVWALYFTRPYLNMEPTVVPAGREYLSAIQTHTVWERVRECGVCGLWFGNVRGGFPAFVDPAASTLHPLVVFSTFIWGVVNGSKIALVGVFVLAGLAQWWLGCLLGLRWPARVWGAALAVCAGYLSARMELGAFSLVLSTASAVPVFPAVIALARSTTWRSVVLAAAFLALLAVGGTGYIQVGMVFVMPAALLLSPWDRPAFTRLLRRFAQAIGIALLFAGPFLVPFVHFLPEFAKDFDLTFKSAQPFAYVPLNLVIREVTFYLNDLLGKQPWPAHYVNFVGWIPILLATYGLFGFPNAQRRREVLFLGAAALLALWTASGTPLLWMAKVVKIQSLSELLGGVRYTAFIAGLAVPPILGLASIGLDRLLSGGMQRLRLSFESVGTGAATLSADLRWLVAIPLVVAVNQARTFSGTWVTTAKIDPNVPGVLAALHTPSLEWVNVPLGEHFFVAPAMAEDLKLVNDFFRTWHWRDRQVPKPVLEANRNGPPAGMEEQSVLAGFHIHAAVVRPEYAAVMHPDGSQTACAAHGTGGSLDVNCSTTQSGYLIVQENNWSGWRVAIDGAWTPLREGDWLSVDAPPGEHTYSFRYHPWDVALGFALLLVGVVTSAWLLRRPLREIHGKAEDAL